MDKIHYDCDPRIAMEVGTSGPLSLVTSTKVFFGHTELVEGLQQSSHYVVELEYEIAMGTGICFPSKIPCPGKEGK